MKKSMKVLVLSCFMSVIAFSAWACTVSVSENWTDAFGNSHTTTATATASSCRSAFNLANSALQNYRRTHHY
jgi:hypothetical protein